MGLSRAAQRRQKANARLVVRARRYIDLRRVAALQPHRRGLPEEHRLAQEAENECGRLLLCGEICAAEHNAGTEYARRRGAYYSTIGGPSSLAGAGDGFDCNPAECSPPNCECFRRRVDYMEVYNALIQGNPRNRILSVVEMVVLNDCPPGEELGMLKEGLRRLAKVLGLDKR